MARWQIPENWTFVAEIPKAAVGKFDKKVLRARADLPVLSDQGTRPTVGPALRLVNTR